MLEDSTMRLSAIGLILTLALGILVAPLAAEAQPPKHVSRLGYLSAASAERDKPRLAGLQQGLHELGYVEGNNLLIERRYAAGQFAKLPDLAADLIQLKIDVLVVGDAPAAQAAKEATSTLPIVMTGTADPVGAGLVASLARPGGNMTGLSDFNAGVVTKRLEFVTDVVPAVSRVAVLWNPANPTNPLQWQLTQAAAPALRVTLLSLEAKGSDDIERAFATMRQERPGALLVFGDPMLSSRSKQIIELAGKSRLPAIYSTREIVEAGGLMSYGTNFVSLFRRAATYIDKILKGAKPADLPVEQPMQFELVINLKTAQALGITMPPSLLLLADEVIRKD
jgi:putative tryptophan/tyrosine transport system substrate-binding protein